MGVSFFVIYPSNDISQRMTTRVAETDTRKRLTTFKCVYATLVFILTSNHGNAWLCIV